MLINERKPALCTTKSVVPLLTQHWTYIHNIVSHITIKMCIQDSFLTKQLLQRCTTTTCRQIFQRQHQEGHDKFESCTNTTNDTVSTVIVSIFIDFTTSNTRDAFNLNRTLMRFDDRLFILILLFPNEAHKTMFKIGTAKIRIYYFHVFEAFM